MAAQGVGSWGQGVLWAITHGPLRLSPRDFGFLLLHAPHQDCGGHSTPSQLLLGPHTGEDPWGQTGRRRGGAGAGLAL